MRNLLAVLLVLVASGGAIMAQESGKGSGKPPLKPTKVDAPTRSRVGPRLDFTKKPIIWSGIRKPTRFTSTLFRPLYDHPLPPPLRDTPIYDTTDDDDHVLGVGGSAVSTNIDTVYLVPKGIAYSGAQVAGAGITRVVVGTLTNERKELVSLSVDVNFYDAAGVLIRNRRLEINDLGPGEKWTFRFPFGLDVDSYKVVRISAR